MEGWIVATAVSTTMLILALRQTHKMWLINKKTNLVNQIFLLDRRRALENSQACLEYAQEMAKAYVNEENVHEYKQLSKMLENQLEHNNRKYTTAHLKKLEELHSDD